MAMSLVLCVRNNGNAASLEKRKIYVAIPDSAAARHGKIRVIDESGEDYLYPESFFVPVTLISLGFISFTPTYRAAIHHWHNQEDITTWKYFCKKPLLNKG